MRGRDYGLPDYNTVREQMGLPRIDRWEEINPLLNKTNPEVFVMQLYMPEYHGSVGWVTFVTKGKCSVKT